MRQTNVIVIFQQKLCIERMDIDQARTFLAIADTGSFHAAAQRLNLTQTAVSARVRALEDQLGRRLFVRNKAGARLTAAGGHFMRHANALVHVWERARRQVALPAGRHHLLSIGAELATNDDDRLIQAIRNGGQDTINDAGQQIVRRQLNVAPTLTIRPGFPVRVIVTRDIVLEPYGG